jgi:TolB-like protein
MPSRIASIWHKTRGLLAPPPDGGRRGLPATIWHRAREYLTHWAVAGVIVLATGVAPDHLIAHLFHELHIPLAALHLWAAGIDLRWLAVAIGLALIVGDIVWRRSRAAGPAVSDSPPPPAATPLDAVPDKPSIAVLPFLNFSGDPAQEYFSDGITDGIITELSRFRGLFVISRNSGFTYKNQSTDVRQVARELGVRYVLEGGARKSGNRVRVSARLVDARAGNQIWAETYERDDGDDFAVEHEVTRGIVAAVAPELELAEIQDARQARGNDTARHLVWRAYGLMNDGVRSGHAPPVLEAIGLARRAIDDDPTSLGAYNVLAWCYWSCHLYRWGDEPTQALARMAAAVERMASINALDHRTLTVSGLARIGRGEPERGLADLRRAVEVNPNAALSLMWLALSEAMTGHGEEATAHATLSLRLNPRDSWIGVAHVALALVRYSARDYAEAARLAELAIQSEPAVPLRRAIMIASCGQLGESDRAAREIASLAGFAPDFPARLMSGDFTVFRVAEHAEHLRDGLRKAGVPG